MRGEAVRALATEVARTRRWSDSWVPEALQTHFVLLVFAHSALEAAVVAEEISSGISMFEAVQPVLGLGLVVSTAIVPGPLLTFTLRLWACRMKGLRDYMQFAANCVNHFDGKWLGAGATPGEPLLGAPDLQSLADPSNSVRIVRNMLHVPMSLRTLRTVPIAQVVPPRLCRFCRSCC